MSAITPFTDGILIHGDNLGALVDLAGAGLTAPVTLVYADPPFLTKRQHFTADGRVAFDDRWPSRDAYLDSPKACRPSRRTRPGFVRFVP